MAENQGPDQENEPELFEGEEALELARQGKDAWNEWAEENPGREVDFKNTDFTTEENRDISFEGFIFPGDVNFFEAKFLYGLFYNATFIGGASFLRSSFVGNAVFSKAVFAGQAEFMAASFDGFTVFSGATFEKKTSFVGTTFSNPVSLNGSKFRIPPDFRGTDFQKHFTLNSIEVYFSYPTGTHDADMYRRLKELAANARDHDREQMFFAYELIAKRGHETRGLSLIPNYLYEILSNFGRSLTLPCFWLICVWFMFGIFYRWLETSDKANHIWDGLSFSAAQLLPFLGASKEALGDAKTALYGEGPLSVGINFLGIIEGGFGLLLLFLIGLALRNRFRI